MSRPPKVYGVTGDTPIVTRQNGKIKIIAIEEVYDLINSSVGPNQSNWRKLSGKSIRPRIEVWDRDEFVPVRDVIRQKPTSRIVRVSNHYGTVCVTTNHPIIDYCCRIRSFPRVSDVKDIKDNVTRIFTYTDQIEAAHQYIEHSLMGYHVTVRLEKGVYTMLCDVNFESFVRKEYIDSVDYVYTLDIPSEFFLAGVGRFTVNV